MPDPVDPVVDPAKKDPPAGDQQPAAGKTFTQAELDQHIADRLKREREKFADYADLKKKADEHDKALEARKTEEEKLKERAEKAEQREQEALAKANARVLRAEILAKAGAFVDPEDVYLALREKLAVDADGNIAGLDDELKALAKAKPHWVKKPGQQALGAGNPGNGAGQGETDAQRRKRLGF